MWHIALNTLPTGSLVFTNRGVRRSWALDHFPILEALFLSLPIPPHLILDITDHLRLRSHVYPTEYAMPTSEVTYGHNMCLSTDRNSKLLLPTYCSGAT